MGWAWSGRDGAGVHNVVPWAWLVGSGVNISGRPDAVVGDMAKLFEISIHDTSQSVRCSETELGSGPNR